MRVAAFYLRFCPHDDAPTAGFISIPYTLYTVNICACWEIGGFDIFHQAICINFRIVNICATTINDFSKVMCGNVCRHADGNPVTSIDKQIGNLCRHYSRLQKRVVEIVCHVDSILLEVIHDVFSHL